MISSSVYRYMTVLFYLNEVKSGGETAFPFANKESIDENVGILCLQVPPFC
jgi:hypothetical protein